MSTVRGLHDEAMVLAQESILARALGTPDKAVELARQALRLEVKAAKKIDVAPGNEPTRSILFKSAASLALQSREFDYAERLIAEALRGYPPSNVRSDLESIQEQVRFERNLESGELEFPGDHSVEELTGTLISADARNEGLIGLQTTSGYVELVVPHGLVDLVRTYFHSEVATVVEIDDNKRILRSLQELEA